MKIFGAVLLVLCAVAVLFMRHRAPSVVNAQPAPTVQPAPVIIKDRATQLEAAKALQDRFLASGIDATVNMLDAQDCKDRMKKNDDMVKSLHLRVPKTTFNCEEEPVQLTVKYDLANGVFAYQLAHDKNFLETLHLLGFTRVVLVNTLARKHWIWFGTENGFSSEWREDSY
jgi:hypothetical protein